MIQQQQQTEPSSPNNTHQNLIRSKTFTQNDPNPKLREKLIEINKNVEDHDDLVVDVSKFAISDSNCQNGQDDVNQLTNEMSVLKDEVIRQQTTLKVAIEKLKQQRKPIQVCSVCSCQPKRMQSDVDQDTEAAAKNENVPETNKFVDVVLNTTNNIDFLETKRKADALNSNDRICPMCGRIYPKDTVFEEFSEHVETHFVDSDEDISIELDKYCTSIVDF